MAKSQDFIQRSLVVLKPDAVRWHEDGNAG